jgi:hypothetical protein
LLRQSVIFSSTNLDVILNPLFMLFFEQFKLLAIGTARQGTALELTYRVELKSVTSLVAVTTELTALEGVQTIEVRASE